MIYVEVFEGFVMILYFIICELIVIRLNIDES